MSLVMTLECDGRGCCTAIDINDHSNPEKQYLLEGWHNDPDHDDTHYCPYCWNDVKREIERKGSTA